MDLINLNKNIEVLRLDSAIIKILKENSVSLIKDLWSLKRTDLKKYKLTDTQIHQIIIKMQLFGFDLNRKIYKKY